ncbi:MAG: MBL fold metallo-hydrolase [Coriobacteriales bacterium]|jgi:phosphoribosyl 1,2-cyclic phosphodiesterase|nr:MBL fold metallo-hydrolase [Coriobacteriales bacterium]
MRLHVLGSGSKGNAAVVQAPGGAVLIDCGFNKKTLAERLAQAAVDPASIRGILITHEHSDHVAGLGVVLRGWQKLGIEVPVYTTEKTRRAAQIFNEIHATSELRSFKPMETFALAGMSITAFPTSHDAAEPVGFRIEGAKEGAGESLGECEGQGVGESLTQGARERTGQGVAQDVETGACAASTQVIGYMTDTGQLTGEARELLQGCHILALETNHDAHMLQAGPYPYQLKHRVASSRGHLSNMQAAEALQEILSNNTQCVVGMHLSQINNEPHLPRRALEEIIARNTHGARVLVASQFQAVDA